MKKEISSYWLIVILVFLAAALVRFVGLTSWPPGIYPDEAMNISDGLGTAEKGGWEWFYENNQGREALYMNILGYLMHWFGPTLFVVRFLPAMIGFLTLPAVFWIGKRLFSDRVALYSLALTAFSYWHLNFSRIGFRALMMVLMISWGFALLTEALYRLKGTGRKKKNSGDSGTLFFGLSGLFFGISLHTYIAVRIVPAVIFVALFVFALFYRDKIKILLRQVLIFSFFALLTAAPLLLDFWNFPEHFSGRTNNVSVFKAENMPAELARTTSLTLASFLFYGDQNWRHNYPYLPVILPIWGIPLLCGFVLAIYNFFATAFGLFFRQLKVKEEELWSIFGQIFLAAWWFLLLMPSVLTVEGIPHALRSIGAIPPTFLLAAFVAVRWAKGERAKKVLAALVIFSSLLSVFAYFFLWGRSTQAYDAFEYRLSGMGIFLRDRAAENESTHLYVVANNESLRTSVNLPVAAEPIRFYTWSVKDRVEFILPENLEQIAIKAPAKIVMMQEDSALAEKIQQKFPFLTIKKLRIGSLPVSDPGTVNFQPQGEEGFLNPNIPVYAEFTILESK